METLDVQIYKFVFVTFAGIIIGVVVDAFRAWRASARPRRWLGYLTDALMVVSVSCLLVVLVIHATWGELRFYTFTALALGYGCYSYLASATTLWAFCHVFSFLRCICGHIRSLVLIPIKWLSQLRAAKEEED